MIERGECYEFRDPIHGMISINELEREIINTVAFQRLRHIRQLATSYMVYHGAEHTRFGHSLGVMHIASKALEAIREKEPLKTKLNDFNEYNKIKYTLRLAALLHDVGHAPFSHAGEDLLFPRVTDVDGSEGTGHEVYTRLIIRDKFTSIIDSYFDKTGVKTSDVLSLLKGNTRDNKLRFTYDIISGQLDADKMDYLLRDSHYCGVNYGVYDLDKMLNSLCICESQDGDWQLGIMSDGIYSAEEFVYARYWMFLQVYFHKTRRIYDRYLVKFLQDNFKKYPVDINKYLDLDDSDVLQAIKDSKERNEWAKSLFERKHIKEAFISPTAQLEEKDLDRIAWTIDRFIENYKYDDTSSKLYVDQADSSTAKGLINVPHYLGEAETEEEETAKETRLPAIPVKDKHTGNIGKIQDYSLPLRGISDKKINILRIYAPDDKIDEIKNFCNKSYNEDYNGYIKEKEEKQKKYAELAEELEIDKKQDADRRSRYQK